VHSENTLDAPSINERQTPPSAGFASSPLLPEASQGRTRSRAQPTFDPDLVNVLDKVPHVFRAEPFIKAFVRFLASVAAEQSQ
jgi:hypothetical protein